MLIDETLPPQLTTIKHDSSTMETNMYFDKRKLKTELKLIRIHFFRQGYDSFHVQKSS